ncbi:hypothetical protein [Infirmifilum sp. SLHALR2]|nr:MAG: hypothetical protein B7L53_06845 [Thermofilum sp. NZ13]
MPILVDEMRLLYSLPFARSLRELARLAGVSPNTAVKFYNEWSLRGRFVMVPDDAYFGFARVVYIAEKTTWPGSLPYGSLEVMTLSSPRGEHTLVHGLVPRVLVDDYVRDLAATLGEGSALAAQEVQHWIPISKLQGLRPVDAERLPKLVDSLLPALKRAEPLDMPDVWDLVYLTGKMMLGPFARPSDLLRRLQPLFWLPIPAQTTRSYHYKLHFLPGWLYTTFRERRSPRRPSRWPSSWRARTRLGWRKPWLCSPRGESLSSPTGAPSTWARSTPPSSPRSTTSCTAGGRRPRGASSSSRATWSWTSPYSGGSSATTGRLG